jgi:SAM-dependent methyltransferase
VGVEADKNVQAVAERYGLDIRVGIFDPKNFIPASFDFVTLDQVAEHVTDPQRLFRDVAHVLKSGGTLVVTTPNAKSAGAFLFGKRWLNWHAPYHLQFYTRQSLELLAANAGFRIVKRKVVTASEWQYYQWRHLLSFPKPGEKSDFWAPNPDSHALPKFYERLLTFARKFRLQQWLSRLLDALQVGDGNLFILRKL